ncbi:MAG: hypothetical protein AAF518_00535 [Spirochaetota bacterium]
MKTHAKHLLGLVLSFALTILPLTASSNFQKTMKELEKALLLLELALEEPSIDKKKLSKISHKIHSLKKDLNTIVEEDEKKVESEFAKLIDLFVKTMKDKKDEQYSQEITGKRYETLYKELYKNIRKKRGKEFTEKYTRDVKDLMHNHRIILKDKIRFLIALNRVWSN